MIYTVTFNPSLDYIVTVEDFALGMTNRTTAEQMFPGGKGINVSFVLNNLGIENTALGFIAGFVGDEISRRVGDTGCRHRFIRLADGCSRINMKIKNIDGTEINGLGPDIDEKSIDMLLGQIQELQEGDILVLAGSIPKSLPEDIYKNILAMLSGKNVTTVVDATGELLVNVLEYRPFLIKPNNHELGEIFQTKLKTREDVVPYGRKLQEAGARNVLVSMAGEGAVLIAEDGSVYMAPAPEGKLVNAVGAGDSMVAGFIAGWLEKKDYEHAFKMGIACGSASAFSETLTDRAGAMAVYERVNAGRFEG